MEERAVQLQVGTHRVRVVSSASPEELERLADMVSRRLQEVGGGRETSQTLLLAAISLAHEVEAQRKRADQIAVRAQEALTSILHRLDDALAQTAADAGSASPDAADAPDP